MDTEKDVTNTHREKDENGQNNSEQISQPTANENENRTDISNEGKNAMDSEKCVMDEESRTNKKFGQTR